MSIINSSFSTTTRIPSSSSFLFCFILMNKFLLFNNCFLQKLFWGWILIPNFNCFFFVNWLVLLLIIVVVIVTIGKWTNNCNWIFPTKYSLLKLLIN
uniref:Uncharacterized protein n=1 Tax=Meloidogyne incognita TaxID=6306 RepID=A0A914MG70_MELIC